MAHSLSFLIVVTVFIDISLTSVPPRPPIYLPRLEQPSTTETRIKLSEKAATDNSELVNDLLTEELLLRRENFNVSICKNWLKSELDQCGINLTSSINVCSEVTKDRQQLADMDKLIFHLEQRIEEQKRQLEFSENMTEFIRHEIVNPKYPEGMIINPGSSMVLEVTDNKVRLNHSSRTPEQLWTLHSVGNGRFRFKNKSNGNYLDIENTEKCARTITKPLNISSSTQQWNVNGDETYSTAADPDLVLDIKSSDYSPGTDIIIFTKVTTTGISDNRKFIFL